MAIFRYLYRPVVLCVALFFFATTMTDASENPDNKPFLTSSASTSQPFVGQEVLLTYTLYFKDNAPKISSETSPSLPGLWAKESAADRFIRSIPTTVHGEQFRCAVVKQFRLVPVQSGRLTVSGYTMQCVLPQQGGKELTDTRIEITAPAILIAARSLPEPVPGAFSGAVGDFTLDVRADKQHLNSGEPLSLTMTLTGTGSLNTLKIPELQLPDSFRHNPPTRTITLNKESALTSGSISTSVTSWPQAAGDFQIPALRLVVFNPETRQFSTLSSKPLAITVTPAAQGEGSMTGDNGPFKTILPSAQSDTPRPFISTIIVILVALACIVVVLKRKKYLGYTEKKRSNRTDEHPANSGISAGMMKQQLFAALEDAGVKSPGGLTRKELEGELMRIDMTKESQSALPAILDSLDRIIYSPAEKKDAPIPELIIAGVKTLLNELKKTGSSR
ncbi:MAG: protein BatD [Chlorobium sp.]|nr:MAG: protein BatD [Chlorobium sp.]